MYLHNLNQDEKMAFLKLAHIVAQANGVVDESEEKMIEAYVLEMGLNANVHDLEELSLAEVIPVFESEESKKIAFLEAIAIALADGIYHDEEKAIMKELRESFALSVEYYEELKQWIAEINRLYAKGNELIFGANDSVK